MIANDRAVIAPAREDAPHCPAFAVRPLTRRAWPSHPVANLNDNRTVDDDVLLLEVEAPPEAPPALLPPPLATAAYGLACAASLAIAVVYLIAR